MAVNKIYIATLVCKVIEYSGQISTGKLYPEYIKKELYLYIESDYYFVFCTSVDNAGPKILYIVDDNARYGT